MDENELKNARHSTSAWTFPVPSRHQGRQQILSGSGGACSRRRSRSAVRRSLQATMLNSLVALVRPKHARTRRRMLPPASLSPCPRLQPRGPTRADASLRSNAGRSTCAGPHPDWPTQTACMLRACRRTPSRRRFSTVRVGQAGLRAAGRRTGRLGPWPRSSFKRARRQTP